MHTRDAFIGTARAVRPLLDEPSLAAGWNSGSVLELMTVGSLAAHLTRAVLTVDTYLTDDQPGRDDDPIDAVRYFLGIDGLSSIEGPDLSGPLHTGIRDRAQQGADAGVEAARSAWDQAMHRIEPALATAPASRTISVFGGRRMEIDEYIITRLVELVVHGEDLAVSLEVESPDVPQRALELVLDCLIGVATARHGMPAVIRAMTRTERDRIRALRVL